MQRDRGRADHAHPWVQAPQLLHMRAPMGGQNLGAQLRAPIPTLGMGDGGGLLSFLPRPTWPQPPCQPQASLCWTPLISSGLKL